MAEILVLRDSNVQNVPEALRRIAEEIEAGEYGQTEGCALVLTAGGKVVTFYCGQGEAAPNFHFLCGLGQAKMCRTVLDASDEA